MPIVPAIRLIAHRHWNRAVIAGHGASSEKNSRMAVRAATSSLSPECVVEQRERSRTRLRARHHRRRGRLTNDQLPRKRVAGLGVSKEAKKNALAEARRSQSRFERTKSQLGKEHDLPGDDHDRGRRGAAEPLCCLEYGRGAQPDPGDPRAPARDPALHRNAQCLLEPLAAVNPYAPRLTFADARTRTRRDHMKYLTLIHAIALAHQHQRPVRPSPPRDGEDLPDIEVTRQDILAPISRLNSKPNPQIFRPALWASASALGSVVMSCPYRRTT